MSLATLMTLEGGRGLGGGRFRNLIRWKQADSDRVYAAAEGQQLTKDLNVLELVTICATMASLTFFCSSFC